MSHLLAICCAIAALVFLALWLRQKKATQRASEKVKTSLKRQKKRLRKEQDQLLDALSDSFLLVDPNGQILFANEVTTELVAGRLVLERNIKEIFLDERLTRAIEKSLTTGREAIERVVLPQQASPRGMAEKRGETAWLIDASPLNKNATKPITRVVIRDITAEHQTEQVRKDFVANASHELRTPLSIINGYLENLVEGEIDDPQFIKRSLLIMQKHGERIARIVEDMLMISRLESGEITSLNLSPFNYSSCIHDVVERLESVINQQKATVQLNDIDEHLTLLGDRFYWTQVFFNLIENALKQNPSKPLNLAVGGKSDENGEVTLWVSDNGVGIPSTDLPFVFKRFYRVEKHHSQDSIKGTGLGLSIVKRAVEAHQGTIAVTSTPGQRTTFTIQLPSSVSQSTSTNE
ncbi:MAG: sensor histidine kinase [Roseibacillus sp.]